MTKEERDRIIIEELGGCFHNWKVNKICSLCGLDYGSLGSVLPDLSTPSGFFWAWHEMLKKEELFVEFIGCIIQKKIGDQAYGGLAVLIYFLSHRVLFMEVLAEFLEERKK